ncbi:hypothetical protein AYL99_03922 [Fonsecaea erecta]|uniref:Xylanolytic transcriptional activator regulatory domain-containing protein n=1 Tax=Fonsecaea erecta TaxID=1367422 RepID=A0A178ZPH8_9EURO|nr:hypothetical protein AYL99_03922 [Fonsecaea erecta]OAP61719.1 hypothetical protein AYL99_03922 [Fonsecaea erecta]
MSGTNRVYFDLLQQSTICPKDVCLVPEDGTPTYQATKEEEEDSKTRVIAHISIPYNGYDDELSASGITPSPAFDLNRLDSNISRDYSDIEDLLFNSVGLERVYECWQKLQQNSAGLGLDDGFQPCEGLLFSKRLQDKLIEAYFQQFHPICPAVDQSDFLKWYKAPQQDVLAHPQLMRLLLLSVLFAALPHIDEDLLRGGPRCAVKQAQKAVFSSAQTLYHRLEWEFMGTEGLAQSALLLSYWSPYDSTREVNGYWVDEAIRHAVAGGMADLYSTRRKRIIWWCCMIRNRMISLGLRRFDRLERRPEGRLPELSDFAEEGSGGHLISLDSKLYFTRVFILLCKLTKIMVDSVRLKYRDYNSTWTLPEDRQAFDILEDIGQLDEKLKIWGVNFAHLYAAVQDLRVPNADLVIFHLIGLMHQFAVSILYEPFLRLSDSRSSQAWFVKDLALLKIKEASRNTAAITASMLRFANPKDLSIIVPPWIILPIALHLIQLSEPQDLEAKTEITQQLGYLMRTLHTLMCRFEGAQFIIKIVNAIIMLVRNSTEEMSLNQSSAWLGTAQGQSVGAQYTRLRQEEVVTHVLETIQNGLANEVIQT